MAGLFKYCNYLRLLNTVGSEKQVIVVDLYWLKKPSCIPKYCFHFLQKSSRNKWNQRSEAVFVSWLWTCGDPVIIWAVSPQSAAFSSSPLTHQCFPSAPQSQTHSGSFSSIFPFRSSADVTAEPRLPPLPLSSDQDEIREVWELEASIVFIVKRHWCWLFHQHTNTKY